MRHDLKGRGKGRGTFHKEMGLQLLDPAKVGSDLQRTGLKAQSDLRSGGIEGKSGKGITALMIEEHFLERRARCVTILERVTERL